MTDPIQPKHLRLGDLLKGRLFTVPDYQRSYSWERRQRRDLFDDITDVWKDETGTNHFMATIVCLRRKSGIELGTDVFSQLELVDGQQRLTTLIILLNAIRYALGSNDEIEERSLNELKHLLVKPDGDNLLLLQTNHDSTDSFENYLRKGEYPSPKSADTIADRNILSAIKECNDFVASWLEREGTVLGLLKLVKNQLTFIIHEVDDEKTVYTVFEVLNSRGIPVAWLDRLKSILMANAFSIQNEVTRESLIKDLHKIWRDIYSIIGLRQGLSTESLRFAATLLLADRPSKPLGEQDSVDALRKIAGRSPRGVRRVAQWLKKVTEACQAVESNPRIDAVTRITQARLLAVALHVGKVNQIDGLLAAWEKVSFRIYGLHGKDTRTGVGDYCRLAWDIVDKNMSDAKIRRRIRDIGRDFPVAEGIKRIRGQDCYTGWKEELRYFLFRYEEYLASMHGLEADSKLWEHVWRKDANQSIEHIRPQRNCPNAWVHTLGNLVLLPARTNSKLGGRSPRDKVTTYRKSGFQADEVADMLDGASTWTQRKCKARERKLLDWAKNEWAE